MLESQSKTTETQELNPIPPELKGRYGIEDGIIDYDGLQRDGKWNMYWDWENRRKTAERPAKAPAEKGADANDAAKLCAAMKGQMAFYIPPSKEEQVWIN